MELCSHGPSACATAAALLLLDAQQRGEPAAWLTDVSRCFYPPDLASLGVDLAALAVVRVPASTDVARAADPLARSGAFGLLVLDLGATAVPTPLLSRLMGLAHKHQTAVVFLTQKPASAPSLGSLVSLRAQALRTQLGPGRFQVEVQAQKDKRRAPGWTHVEVCRGPVGLR